ncbi:MULTISPECIES: hypothetical protein [unclassified Streptomyces]|uniref:hypothetical protein n=1 Tax=unclassified Streptomyces TaxID=2593676 RepID=UPI001902E612|nr:MULTISPECIES: hypothetical protein [unclassified Streptomyces]MCU4747293.1 hypothetical protein [Streptomyces sp. G-5]QQN77925.1 hypothetical protein IPZ77_11110 [Streptomyces sp. XC 2026]
MRTRGSARTAAAAAVAAVLLLSGCGGDDGAGREPKQQEREEQQDAQDGDDGGEEGSAADDQGAHAEDEARSITGEGLDGVWESIVDDNDIETLTITGDTVETTGPLSCPGTVTGAADPEPVIELACDVENPNRVRGTLELNEEGNRLFIGWEGQAWGGMIDSMIRVG